jgi:putative membrane protein
MTSFREVSGSRLARSLLFLAISFFISWLAGNGKLAKIVHPRMNLWIEGAGGLFLVLAFFQMLWLSRKPKRPDPLSFFVPFAFVLAITFIFVQSNSFSLGQFDEGADSVAVENAILSKRNKIAAQTSKGALPSTVAFDDDRYWTLYNRLYDDPSAAIGHRVVIQGFFHRASGYPADTALIGRNLMWCCSADMSGIGLLARGSGIDGFEESEWVEASGRLSTTEFDMNGDGKNTVVPLIVFDSLKSIDKGATSSIIFPF